MQQLSRERMQQRLLEGLGRAQSLFVAKQSATVCFESLLQLLLEVTGSEYGFLAETIQHPGQPPFLLTRAIAGGSWDAQTQELLSQSRPRGMQFANMDTLFGEVLKTGAPVVANDAGRHQRPGQMPHGHPPLHHFLGLPLRAGDELIGMIGIANREGGYTHELANWLEPYASVCAGLIAAYRTLGQKAQLESERDAFFEHSRGMHVIATMQGHFLTVNPTFSQFLGWTREQLCERPIAGFLHRKMSPYSRRRCGDLGRESNARAMRFVFVAGTALVSGLPGTAARPSLLPN